MATSGPHTIHTEFLRAIGRHLQRLANKMKEDPAYTPEQHVFVQGLADSVAFYIRALENADRRTKEKPLQCPRCPSMPAMPSKYRHGCYYCVSCARYYVLTSVAKDVLIPVDEEPDLP